MERIEGEGTFLKMVELMDRLIAEGRDVRLEKIQEDLYRVFVLEKSYA